ncbi:MAG: hypothetical protein QOG88_817, partial [Actinomycetota bacterium]|nr:hypothetical protein [Actinomycetota bacterium]
VREGKKLGVTHAESFRVLDLT